MSVSHARCLLKGASGHPPRRVLVALGDRSDGSVWLCVGIRARKGSGGIERVRHVASNATNAKLCEIIVEDSGGCWIEYIAERDAVGGHASAHNTRICCNQYPL